MEKLYSLLQPYARLPFVLSGFALIILFNTVGFPAGAEKIKSTAPNTTGPLDLEFSYSPEKAYQMIDSYGEEGRAIYMKSIWLVDFPYPIIYSITYALLLVFLLKKTNASMKNHFLILIPFGVFFFDILENIGITMMLRNFPNQPAVMVQITSIFSSLKWTAVGIFILSILFLLGKLLIKNVSKNKKSYQ